ncbi:unnamed protein product [Linum tenue]|uniref:LysM domain receptor-like kinase 3 n=1 Tax=Linum tenue TaxID=586396 RepID=A0AAV0HZK6_9ROSI|nr:unnamed protein product [Linum tenue]
MAALNNSSFLTTTTLLIILPIASQLLFLLINAAPPPNSSPSLTMYPFNCSQSTTTTCNASLYHATSLGRHDSTRQIATYYSVNETQLHPITGIHNRQDYLVTVPCSCGTVSGTTAYFHAVNYAVQQGDTFSDVSAEVYSGQVWVVGDEKQRFVAGNNVTMNLVCGCLDGKGTEEEEGEVIVTYTVEDGDTLAGIADRFQASLSRVVGLNELLTQNPGFIDVGWVLYVLKGSQVGDGGGGSEKWTVVAIVLSVAATLLLIAGCLVFVWRRKRYLKQQKQSINGMKLAQDQKAAAAGGGGFGSSISSYRTPSVLKSFKDFTGDFEKGYFDAEGPVRYNIEEIEEATNNFDESKKIGEGGYAKVFFGILRGQEVAVKMMRSNKSKEFYAELKVLCKVHHINVVELLGYASGDDHVFLVYEYVRNGSLSDHLHDPLLRGYQPLSWSARTQIAVDAAKGIEYIHDHTKTRYVHRDIKSTNILLDDCLRAKVADFGLAKLVERSNDDELIATRLVGTPGYLPPESVKELQVTSKTDVFAFGVLLGELITGKRALVRDNKEPGRLKSLITTLAEVFEAEEPQMALEEIIDLNLRSGYPLEEIYKMAEIAQWCLSEEAMNRPEMRDIVGPLAQIVTASVEWEASMGGDSQVFSGIFNGR